jgi:glutathione S-transferase
VGENELPVLHQLRFSHYNEKARWALDYKGIEHRRRSHLPVFHAFRAKRLWGELTLPCAIVDGKAVGESSEIIAELERRWPDPPLYPPGDEARSRALELEAYFDKRIGPHIRRVLFYYLLPDSAAACDFLAQGFSAPARAAYRAAFPGLRVVFDRALRVDETGKDVGWERILEALDRIEAELQPSGYLVGTSFTVADLGAAAMLFPLLRPREAQCELPDPWPEPVEELRSSVEDRDAFRWGLRIWREHRGTSAAVSD